MDKPKIIAAGGLVLNAKEELLMIFRRGYWDLPKGKWEEDETIEEGALREVQEETGLTQLKLGDLVGLTYHEYFNTFTNEDVVKETHWFWMRSLGNEALQPQTAEDIEIAEWVPKTDIAAKIKNTYPNIIDILQKAHLA